MVEYSKYHHPLFRSIVPENIRIAKIFYPWVFDDGILFIFLPCSAIVNTIGNALSLIIYSSRLFFFCVMIGVYCNKGRFIRSSKTSGVTVVDDSTSGENISQAIRIQSYRKMFPVSEILAHSMTPMHRSPHGAVRIVLIKKVILSVVIYHPVGIIHPFCFWCEMKLRPVGLIIFF